MITGSCHCDAVHWQFDGQPESATACNCTICRRYGVLWAYAHEDHGIRVSGTTQVYVRGGRPSAFISARPVAAWPIGDRCTTACGALRSICA